MKRKVKSTKAISKLIMTGLILLPALASGHSANDPIKDIHKYDRTVTERQARFKQSDNASEKMQNLRDQIDALERKVLTIRNMIASEYSHVSENMSKYKFDYMGSVEVTLAQIKEALKQTEVLIDE